MRRVLGPTPIIHVTLYQGYLTGLQALQGPQHVRIWDRTDKGGRTGRKRGAGTRTGQQLSVGECYRQEWTSIGAVGTVGMAAQ